MLNLYKLQVFMEVVAAGSFTGAAERLLLTQSAISQHVQGLERQLGTRLFQRGPRGVTLTDAGSVLHEYANRIMQLVIEAENAVTDVRNLQSGQITLGTTPGLNIYLVPQWIQTFQQQNQGITLSVQTSTTPQVLNDVLENRIELGIVEGEINEPYPPQLGVATLRQIELFVIIGKGHRCWGRTTAPPDALDGQPFVVRQQGSQTRRWFEAILAEHQIKPRVVAEFDNQESIKHAVATGMGITILPDYAVQREVEAGILRAIPIENVPLTRTLKLVWNQDRAFSPRVSAFLLQLADTFPSIKPVVHA